MSRLFGTDGVRGVANADLTPELAFAIGRAGAAVIAHAAGWTGSFMVASAVCLVGAVAWAFVDPFHALLPRPVAVAA